MKLAVHSLETHPDHARIQKLLYFVYTKVWIADVSVLQGMSIGHLLNLLVQESSSIDQLQTRLLENAERLNKSETYIPLANSIIETLQNNNHSKDPKSALPYDRFQLRYAIMQVLNPLKAKAILIALYQAKSQPPSALNVPININTLNNFSLDELLREVLKHYPKLNSLTAGLQNLQHCPTEICPDERRQLAQTLQEVLRPYLQTGIPQPTVEDDGPAINADVDLDFDPDALCTILMSPQALPVAMTSVCPGDVS